MASENELTIMGWSSPGGVGSGGETGITLGMKGEASGDKEEEVMTGQAEMLRGSIGVTEGGGGGRIDLRIFGLSISCSAVINSCRRQAWDIMRERCSKNAFLTVLVISIWIGVRSSLTLVNVPP
jgi:hypothetical protein